MAAEGDHREARAAKVLAEFEVAIAMAEGETDALAEPDKLASDVHDLAATVASTIT